LKDHNLLIFRPKQFNWTPWPWRWRHYDP